ncbi:Deoxyribodipyrimidine photo-lyase [uncultured Gammaproteobacteria bacterium]
MPTDMSLKPFALSPVLVWFRRDLRVGDNPSLTAADLSGQPIIPVYIHDDENPEGGAAHWWLHHSLKALGTDLGRLGSPIIFRMGETSAVLEKLAAETGADTLYFNRIPTPREAVREARIVSRLQSLGVSVHSHETGLLFPPGRIRTKDGNNFKVFTAFWKTCTTFPDPSPPTPAPNVLKGWATPVSTVGLDALGLLPSGVDWTGGLHETWMPGEADAQRRLTEFVEDGVIGHYDSDRDRPDREGTSRLSPHLAFGEISIRTVWHTVRSMGEPGNGMTRFLTELGWREFCYDLLWHNPGMMLRPLRSEFANFPWKGDKAAYNAWCKGLTGYPIVDAGMRQLWRTGWMHNRVRMITASFLVKHLLCPWQDGERWFRDTLVDADPASNAAGWQWVAGSGTDAAPFFRIFNPILQGERFDPDGHYVRQYVPELAGLPTRWIHQPWNAPPLELAAAGVCLGKNYPHPIVDHGRARANALEAFKMISNVRGGDLA